MGQLRDLFIWITVLSAIPKGAGSLHIRETSAFTSGDHLVPGFGKLKCSVGGKNRSSISLSRVDRNTEIQGLQGNLSQ